MNKTVLRTIVFSVCSFVATSLACVSARTVWTELGHWDFRKASVDVWQRVKVPHSCNAADGQSANYYRGKTYYRTLVSRHGKAQFLYLMGAAQRSVVSVNGKVVAEHCGGYTPYSVDLTPYLTKSRDNVILIECDNTLDCNMAPVSSDFNKNNGLQNKVYLVETDDVFCDFQSMGYDAFHVTPIDVSAHSANIVLNTQVRNMSAESRNIEVVFRVTDRQGKQVMSNRQALNLPANASLPVKWQQTILRPHLWNGLADPYLYKAEVQLWQGKRKLENYSTQFGIRSFALDSVKGFILNGKPYSLRGFSLHQDWQGSASAVSNKQTDINFDIIKELGCNVVRLAHYPHNRYIIEKCDRLGLIVQTEIPWVNECGNDTTLYDQRAYIANLHDQLQEMITNHYNHPSIVFWGLWNELGNIDGSHPQGSHLDKKAVVDATAALYAHAHRLDSTRLVGFADASFGLRTPELKHGTHFDYYAFNTYNGWYSNTKSPYGARGFDKMLQRLHKRAPYVAITEYGSGANPYCHSANPTLTTHPSVGGARHDEEWANIVHECHLQLLCQTPWLQYSTGWIMFDFAVGARREGYKVTRNGVTLQTDSSYMFQNDKGIVTRDRKVKKDAFYLYKACWNHNEPTIYITSHRYAERTSDTLVIKVYSNLHNLTLYQNGRKLQELTSTNEPSGVVWTFSPIIFQRKTDLITVTGFDDKGHRHSDKVLFHHIPTLEN